MVKWLSHGGAEVRFMEIVILSAAKDLLFSPRCGDKGQEQALCCAQDAGVYVPHGTSIVIVITL